MLRRILITSIATTMLAAALPTSAGEAAGAPAPKKLPSCCEEAARHLREHAGPAEAIEKEDRPSARDAQSDDPFVRNQSWGG